MAPTMRLHASARGGRGGPHLLSDGYPPGFPGGRGSWWLPPKPRNPGNFGGGPRWGGGSKIFSPRGPFFSIGPGDGAPLPFSDPRGGAPGDGGVLGAHRQPPFGTPQLWGGGGEPGGPTPQRRVQGAPGEIFWRAPLPTSDEDAGAPGAPSPLGPPGGLSPPGPGKRGGAPGPQRAPPGWGKRPFSPPNPPGVGGALGEVPRRLPFGPFFPKTNGRGLGGGKGENPPFPKPMFQKTPGYARGARGGD